MAQPAGAEGAEASAHWGTWGCIGEAAAAERSHTQVTRAAVAVQLRLATWAHPRHTIRGGGARRRLRPHLRHPGHERRTDQQAARAAHFARAAASVSRGAATRNSRGNTAGATRSKTVRPLVRFLNLTANASTASKLASRTHKSRAAFQPLPAQRESHGRFLARLPAATLSVCSIP